MNTNVNINVRINMNRNIYLATKINKYKDKC